jgi:hypothetical protein
MICPLMTAGSVTACSFGEMSVFAFCSRTSGSWPTWNTMGFVNPARVSRRNSRSPVRASGASVTSSVTVSARAGLAGRGGFLSNFCRASANSFWSSAVKTGGGVAGAASLPSLTAGVLAAVAFLLSPSVGALVAVPPLPSLFTGPRAAACFFSCSVLILSRKSWSSFPASGLVCSTTVAVNASAGDEHLRRLIQKLAADEDLELGAFLTAGRIEVADMRLILLGLRERCGQQQSQPERHEPTERPCEAP